MRKAEVLRQRLVEDAERMREVDLVLDLDLRAAADAPGRAGEVAEAVHRDDDRLVERRDVEGRRQVRQVVLDLMHLAAKRSPGKAAARCSATPARSRLLRRRSSTSARSGRFVSV